MKWYMSLMAVILAATTVPNASGQGCHPIQGCLLFDNGPFTTHPGQGQGCAAGMHISMSEAAPMNVAGFNARWFNNNPEHFRVADTFTVENCPGWKVDCVVVYAYESAFNHPAAPTWNQANLRIWRGDNPGPGGGAVLVGQWDTRRWLFTGIFRTFNGVLDNCLRGVWAIQFDVGCLELEPGRYWLDWQVEGGTNGWANILMEGEKTTPGTAQHRLTSGMWEPMGITSGYPVQPGLPFQIWGCQGYPQLHILGCCPGPVRLRWSCATPNKAAGLLLARDTGNFKLPSGPCAGVTLCLSSRQLQLANPPGLFNTGPNGSGALGGTAGPAICGWHMQMVVIEGPNECRVSNVVQIPRCQ